MTVDAPALSPARRAAHRSRRPYAVLLLLLALVALARAATEPPATAGIGPRIALFEPERLASQEQEAWEAYYYRQWPRLFWLLLQISRTQFGLSWVQAAYAAYVGTQAQVVFASKGDAGGEAQASMQRFYHFVKQPSGAAYDPEAAAAAEVRWWVVHRHRRDYPDYSALVGAMADLYATVYQVSPAAVEDAARHRVEAVAISDRWLDEDKPAGSPLLGQVRDELAAGYVALKAAIASAQP